MKIIGLTGGISTGKSSVSRHLQALGLPVIDCDQLAKQVVQPGTPALAAIIKSFGNDILTPNTGTLDRAKLGKLIFANPNKRRELNAITHPYIRRAIVSQVIQFWIHGEPMVIVDAPLLIESGLHHWMSEVVVVYCPLDVQSQRLMLRDNVDKETAQERISAQAPMSDKLKLATYVLDNSGSLHDLFSQVDHLIPQMRPNLLQIWLWRLGPPTLILSITAILFHLGCCR